MASNELHRDRTIFYSCRYPVVFCPKYQRKVVVPPINGSIKARILEKPDENGNTVREMEVIPNHVHLLLDVDPRIEINVVVSKVKGYTAPDHSPGISLDEIQAAVFVEAVSLEVIKQEQKDQ